MTAGTVRTGHPRLLIDLRWMIPGQAGGLETVALCFLGSLLARRNYGQITLIVPGELKGRFRAALPADVALLSRDNLAGDLRSLLVRIGGARFHAVEPRNYDVAYSLNGRIHPELDDIPAVVLISDLQHLALPHLFSPAEFTVRQAASAHVARRAKRIATISEFSRQEIIKRLGVAPNLVAIAHHAADPLFDILPDQAARNAVLARHNLLGHRYVLLPAQFWPHKNHVSVLSALEKLAGDADPVYLVCTGSVDTNYAPILLQAIEKSPAKRFVRVLGQIDRSDLPALYAGALALVFCSLYEGFGLPVVEAMRVGCPVVAGNSTSLPEIAGDAAVLVDPLDPDAIAAAVRAVRDDKSRRDMLIARGHDRAACFSWDRHCDQILELVSICAGSRWDAPKLPFKSTAVTLPPARRGLSAAFTEYYYPRIRRKIIAKLRPFFHHPTHAMRCEQSCPR